MNHRICLFEFQSIAMNTEPNKRLNLKRENNKIQNTNLKWMEKRDEIKKKYFNVAMPVVWMPNRIFCFTSHWNWALNNRIAFLSCNLYFCFVETEVFFFFVINNSFLKFRKGIDGLYVISSDFLRPIWFCSMTASYFLISFTSYPFNVVWTLQQNNFPEYLKWIENFPLHLSWYKKRSERNER